MKRVLWAAVLASLLPLAGCVGYHRGYESSSSPGCYSCSRTHEHDDYHRHRGGHDRGGHHGHRDHDRDHDDDHHHRRH